MHDLVHCLLSVFDVFTLPVLRSVRETCRLDSVQMQSHISLVSLLGAISTVSLDVITLKPLQETGVSNVAGIRRAYSEKLMVGVFLINQLSYTEISCCFLRRR